MALLRDALKDELGIDPVGGKIKIKGSALAEADTDVNIIVTGTKVDIHKGDGNPTDVCMKSMQSGGLKTEPFGHHLSSRLDDRAFQTVYAGTPVTDQGSNGTVYFPKVSPIEYRIVTHGNAGDLSGPLQNGAAPEIIGDFTENFSLAPGQSYSYNVVPQQAYFLRRIYYRIGTGLIIGIGDSIRAHAYRGTNESGVKIYDHTTYVTSENIGAFVAGAEFPAIITNQITNGIDYSQGEELHWVLSFASVDPTHRAVLVTSVGGASPWRAVDRQQEEHIALVPATSIFKPPIITSPVEGATGVGVESLTVTSAKQDSKSYLEANKTADQTNISTTGTDISFDVIEGNLQYTSTTITLKANETYKLRAYILITGASGVSAQYKWVDTSNLRLPNSAGAVCYASDAINSTSTQAVAVAKITPTVDTVVKLRCTTASASHSVNYVGFYIEVDQTDAQALNYKHGGTVVKVKRNSDQIIVYDNNKVTGLSDTVTPRLSGSTQYSVQAAHYNDLDVPVGRSTWINFKTMMDIVITLAAGASTGDLVELDIGESVNATGYDFHLGGTSDEFPPAAFDSGELRFKNVSSDDLLFKVQSVTGTAPNRTAKVYVEIDALTAGTDFIWLVGAGAAATNVSQIESMWQSASTGGNITVDGDYRVHRFTSSGTFTPDFSGNIAALVVGGGAGADGGVTSGVYGHGGGAGFVNYSDAFAVAVLDKVKKVKRIRLRLSGNTMNVGAHLKEFDIRDASNVRIMNTNMVLTNGANTYSPLLTTESSSEIGKAFDGLQTTHWTLSNATGQSFGIYQEGIFTLNSASILSSISAVCYYEVGTNRAYYRYELDVQYEDVAGTNPNGSDGTWTNIVVAQEIGGTGGTQLEATRTVTNSGTPILVKVGAGGALGAINAQASNGVASSLGSLIALGGLKANNIGAGGDGGDSGKTINGVTTNYNGGTDSTWGGAGGAGAGSTSAGASDTVGSSGGAGYLSSITGAAFEYAKGGNGSGTTSTAPSAPAANTGHGGHGAGTSGMTNGASGVVIVRYPISIRTIHTDAFISI